MEIVYENNFIKVHRHDKEKMKIEREQGVLIINFDAENDDPELKELGPIELLGFKALKDHVGDELLYFKYRPDKRLAIYHLTQHPDSGVALDALKLACKEEGYQVSDVRVHLKEAAKYDKIKKEE